MVVEELTLEDRGSDSEVMSEVEILTYNPMNAIRESNMQGLKVIKACLSSVKRCYGLERHHA